MDDDSGSRENGRHKPDPYRSLHTQWMIPHHQQMKDNHAPQTIKQMAIITERDSAIRERDLALAERETAVAERDMAIFQRDAAISERNKAIMERDRAVAALNYSPRSMIHHHPLLPFDSPETPYDHREETYTSGIKPERFHTQAASNKSTKTGRSKKSDPTVDGNGNGTAAAAAKKHRREWKEEGAGGLNEVTFDESRMPVPVCSCTGRRQSCYKWGNGGWQSACCTTTLSMYPLPVMPNKRHARVNGRKMSGSVFNKLLTRLAAEGHDLGMPIDLKDHWSRHGTNRYIRIK